MPSIYVFSYFPFAFEGRIWDLIVSVPDHCLSFYFSYEASLGWGKGCIRFGTIWIKTLVSMATESKVGKVLTARENPGGKTRVFPDWAILPEMAVLGNTR